MNGVVLHRLIKGFDEIVFKDFLNFYTYKEKEKKKKRTQLIKFLRKQECYNKNVLNEKFAGQDVARIIRELLNVIIEFQIISFPLKSAKPKFLLQLSKATLANKYGCQNKALKELSKAITIALNGKWSEFNEELLAASCLVIFDMSLEEFLSNYNPNNEKKRSKKNQKELKNIFLNVIEFKKHKTFSSLNIVFANTKLTQQSYFLLFAQSLINGNKNQCKLYFDLIKKVSKKFSPLSSDKIINELGILIKSLNKNEYINSLLLLKSTKKKDRIAVFEYVKKHKEFSEADFKKKFKNKDLSKICTNLINAIIDYLLLYHKAQNAKQAIHLGLVKANMLEEIGLNDIAIKFLESVEKLCVKIEDHYSRVIIISELSRLYAHNLDSNKILEKQKQLNKKFISLGVEANNYIELKKIQLKFRRNKVYFSEKEKNNILTKAETDLILNEDVFTNGSFAKSQLFFKSNYLTSIGNFKESLQCLDKLFKLYEKDIKNNDINYFGYLNTLNSLIKRLIKFKSLDKAKRLLSKFDFLAGKQYQNSLRKANYFYTYFNCFFQYHFTTNNHNFILKHEKKCNEIIEELSSELPIYNTFTIWYFLGIAHFYNKKYSKAQHYFNLLLDNKNIKDRKQIESIARLLNYVCTIEQNKQFTDFIKAIKRNTNNYFKKNKYAYKTDELLLEMLNKICYNGNYQKKQKTAIKKSYLPKFKKLQKTETERIKDLGVFEYLS